MTCPTAAAGGLGNSPSKVTLQVAVALKAQRLELGPVCLLRWPPEQLAKIIQGGREFAISWQRYRVDVGLRPRNRVVIEARES